MKLRTSLAIAAVAATGLVVSIASPASAADTVTTFELTGGSLTLGVEPTAALTNAATKVGANTITGDLGEVSVTDTRGVDQAWNVTALSPLGFTGDVHGSASTAVSYTGGVVAETGEITVEDGAATALTATAASVVTATTLSGNNTATWTPTLDVTMPAGHLADTYSGTVTTSLA